jgi:hypothetical protein
MEPVYLHFEISDNALELTWVKTELCPSLVYAAYCH